MTNAVSDTTDLWEEEINEEGTKYLVDGQWHDLIKVPEKIKVKGKGIIEFDLAMTHRGVLVGYDTLKFEKLFPVTDILDGKLYSFAWPMMKPGDTSFDFIFQIGDVSTVKEAFQVYDSLGKHGYQGHSVNVIMADTAGDIGYQMLATMPVRKDRTPYIGLRILDGRTSAHDWEENGARTVPLPELPRSYNPSKGFIATANNRQTSDNALNDYGSGLFSTARALRIDELIQEGIQAGRKFTVEDMKEI